MEIDLTGCWRITGQFDNAIQVREPPIAGQCPEQHSWHSNEPDGTASRGCDGLDNEIFTMDLILPSDNCSVRLDYYPWRDASRGFAISEDYERFYGLIVNGSPRILTWSENTDPRAPVAALEDGTVATHNQQTGGSGRPEAWHCSKEDNERFSAMLNLDGLAAGDSVKIELTWKCTRPPVALLLCDQPETDSSPYVAISPEHSHNAVVAHGIPFLTAGITYSYGEFHLPDCADNSFAPWNGQSTFDAGGLAVKTAHFLGMMHVFDRGHGGWYTPKGDRGYEHFVGDKAGEIILNWADGSSTAVPLIFGFNLWYSRSWDLMWHYSLWGGPRTNHDAVLFGEHDEYRDYIRDDVCLVDGIRPMGGMSCNGRFVFSLDLNNRELASIALKDDPNLHFHPIISGITLEGDVADCGLPTLPNISGIPANTKNVSLEYVLEEKYKPGLDRLMHTFYTFIAEHPVNDQPEVPEGYFGPRYDFGPTREGQFTANFLYRNGPELGSFIADVGMGYTSPVSSGSLPSYQYGFGPWYMPPRFYESLQQWFKLYKERKPGNMPGVGYGWSRGIGEMIREAMAFGYDKFVGIQVDWLDSTMFEETTPPHIHRSPGLTSTIDSDHQVGDVVERGTRENDGHGNCMWARYLVWHWMGRPLDWNEKHLKATEAMVDWIQWQLDTDTIRPGVRKDVLFTESECADEDYDIYSTYACMFGVKLFIRMATQLERSDLVEKWTTLYDRLRQGIVDHLTDVTTFGPIWHVAPYSDWQDHSHRLVHIQLATDGDTYTPLQDYADGDDLDRLHLEISRNSYRYAMKERDYNSLRAYGYGQGMLAQSALLLDEMTDARELCNLMFTCAYLPHMAGWGCPEGIILHRSGEYYLALNGYEGQDSHIADAAKAGRVMIGIDDNDPNHLKLVPRYPADWTKNWIKDYPVLTQGKRQTIEYTYERFTDREEFSFKFETNPGAFSIRFGPLPHEKTAASASIDDKPVPFRAERSGDSNWAWVEVPPDDASGSVTLTLS